ncbi:MAG: RICIN domain-containing protein [Bacteroidota bacterium]
MDIHSKDAKGCTVSRTVVIGSAIACGPVDPDKCYKFIARHSGKALTIKGASNANGADAEQRSYDGDNNQKWKFDEVGGGYYRVFNVNSGKVLDVDGGSTANGAQIQQWPWDGSNEQRWKLEKNSAGYFGVQVKLSGKYMGVENASNANGASVEQRNTNASDYNRQWAITEVGCPVWAKTTPELIVKAGGEVHEDFAVTVQPNPGVTYFNLVIKSGDNTTPVDVKVLDANGRVVAVDQKAGVNTTLRISAEKWTAGMYFAEVTQGGQRIVVKMIKVN